MVWIAVIDSGDSFSYPLFVFFLSFLWSCICYKKPFWFIVPLQHLLHRGDMWAVFLLVLLKSKVHWEYSFLLRYDA